MDKHWVLEMSVKTLNESAGPNGLVPKLLVFGTMPRIPVRLADMPGQVDLMSALEKAHLELLKMIAASRVSRALRSNVLSAAIQNIKIGDELLVYREESKQWEGPHQVLDVDAKWSP